jgi:accessory colonization factor AcfC
MDLSDRDLRSFENYLDSHWETAQQLYRDPDLIRDRRFVRNHEVLNDWLNAHPDAAEALQDNPHKYIWRERASRYTDDRQALSRMRERDLRSFENFLDSHPEPAQRLYEDPDLINDRQFVRNREALNDWLDNHPDAAQALRAHPHKFLWRERNVSPTDFLSQLLQPSR